MRARRQGDALYLLDAGDVELLTESGWRMELRAPRCGEEAATDLKTYLATATARTPGAGPGSLPREALAELGLASRAMLALTSHLSGEALVAGTEAGGGPARCAGYRTGTGGMAGGAAGAAPA